MKLPNEILAHSNLYCSHIWRSIGTHIWFEFGLPKIRPLKNGGRSVEGEMTLHVISDNWRLLVAGQCPLNSDTVSDENFKACGPRWFLNRPFPNVTEKKPQEIELLFSPSILISIFPDSSGEEDDDLSIKLPDESYWGFNFNRGWFLDS